MAKRRLYMRLWHEVLLLLTDKSSPIKVVSEQCIGLTSASTPAVFKTHSILSVFFFLSISRVVNMTRTHCFSAMIIQTEPLKTQICEITNALFPRYCLMRTCVVLRSGKACLYRTKRNSRKHAKGSGNCDVKKRLLPVRHSYPTIPTAHTQILAGWGWGFLRTEEWVGKVVKWDRIEENWIWAGNRLMWKEEGKNSQWTREEKKLNKISTAF